MPVRLSTPAARAAAPASRPKRPRPVFGPATVWLALLATACAASTLGQDAELPPSVLKAVRDTYVSEFGETRYFDASADLNGDGRNELIVYVVGPMACGTGGCPTLVFTPDDGTGYRLVTTISITRTPVRMSAQVTNGWRNLIVHVAGGGATPHDAELEFDGRTYPTNPSVPPARPAAGYEGAVVLIPDFESLSQARIIKHDPAPR